MAKCKYKFFSFFSGSGFLDLGFETNGFDIEFVNEFHPAFMRAYQYSREKMGIKKPKEAENHTVKNGKIIMGMKHLSDEFVSTIKDILGAFPSVKSIDTDGYMLDGYFQAIRVSERVRKSFF